MVYLLVDQLIWSKLDSGRLPNLQEILTHIEDKHFATTHQDNEFSYFDDEV